jgi:vacuolar protein sorting-associated protein 13A/C
LQDAQFVIGENLDACREALDSKTHDSLHLLERISINLQIQKSIAPTAVTLTQFKVSGTLPSLRVNISDTKYKSLMRLIDVAIPKFEDNATANSSFPSSKGLSTDFQLPTLFGRGDQEYHVGSEE